MSQRSGTVPLNTRNQQNSSLAVVFVGVFVGLLGCLAIFSGTYFALVTALGSHRAPRAAYAATLRHVQVNLNIVINQPGMQKDWPGYSPSTLVVPANSLVTVTLRDYDLGDTPLPANSPFTTVQGTIGGMATADGKAYTSLAPEKVAHTFTISQLHLNVPLPGDGAKEADYDTVTFTFRAGKAGTYIFRCYDPCGTGSSGWEGPMVTKGYMAGTLVVQ
jgi:heme/copper-type cytochrome/quinol oxidase subunit 2